MKMVPKVGIAPTSQRLQRCANLPQLLGAKFTLTIFETTENLSGSTMEAGYFASFFSSAEMETLFLEVFGSRLSQLNFQNVGKSRWIRETGAGFKHLFYFYPFRPGADYFPWGAISFDYVPRVEAGKVRLRPGPKHTRVHLVVTRRNDNANRIGRDRATARQTCLSLLPIVVDEINQSLSSVKSTSDACELLRREKASLGIPFYYRPDTAMSFVFTLAKVGHKQEAESELKALLQKQPTYFPPETHAAIRSLLAAI